MVPVAAESGVRSPAGFSTPRLQSELRARSCDTWGLLKNDRSLPKPLCNANPRHWFARNAPDYASVLLQISEPPLREPSPRFAKSCWSVELSNVEHVALNPTFPRVPPRGGAGGAPHIAVLLKTDCRWGQEQARCVQSRFLVIPVTTRCYNSA